MFVLNETIFNRNESNESTFHVENRTLRLAFGSISILIYLFGYTGCLLSIMTFSSRKLRQHSTGFLFLVMACVDLLNLIASFQYFLDVIFQINVFAFSIHWCRFFTIFNYELYFGFSWIFAFITIDRWIKVEWPTRSNQLCTRKNFAGLCLLALVISLLKNCIYTFLCINDRCEQKNLLCEIFINVIYICFYITVPIATILVSICRTCLITINLKRRCRNPTWEKANKTREHKVQTATVKIDDNLLKAQLSSSLVSSPSITTTTSSLPTITKNKLKADDSSARLANYSSYLRRRHSRLDAQMVMLISINVAPFILVHIVNEMAYLFEKYSTFVSKSTTAKHLILLIYLSWYLISATRFYTNCLLSRIYRTEFENRLEMLKKTFKPSLIVVTELEQRRNGSSHVVPAAANDRLATRIVR